MEQMDTLFVLKEKFEEDMAKRGTDPTSNVEKAINGKSTLQVFNILL